jgi:hypothetical protein
LIGAYAESIGAHGSGPALSPIDLDVARRELGRLDPASIPVDPGLPAERAREFRRRVLTAFALEVATAGSTRQASAAARLVEWACPYIRSHALRHSRPNGYQGRGTIPGTEGNK